MVMIVDQVFLPTNTHSAVSGFKPAHSFVQAKFYVELSYTMVRNPYDWLSGILSLIIFSNSKNNME